MHFWLWHASPSSSSVLSQAVSSLWSCLDCWDPCSWLLASWQQTHLLVFWNFRDRRDIFNLFSHGRFATCFTLLEQYPHTHTQLIRNLNMRRNPFMRKNQHDAGLLSRTCATHVTICCTSKAMRSHNMHENMFLQSYSSECRSHTCGRAA